VDFALLLQEALAELQSETSLAVVRNGTELGQFLGGAGDQAGQPLPNIILLDLTLPGKDGFEILQDRKSSPEFATIPVIVFTGSTNPADVGRSYALGANAFVSRPAGFEELLHVMQAIEEFWLEIVSLPRNSELHP